MAHSLQIARCFHRFRTLMTAGLFIFLNITAFAQAQRFGDQNATASVKIGRFLVDSQTVHAYDTTEVDSSLIRSFAYTRLGNGLEVQRIMRHMTYRPGSDSLELLPYEKIKTEYNGDNQITNRQQLIFKAREQKWKHEESRTWTYSDLGEVEIYEWDSVLRNKIERFGPQGLPDSINYFNRYMDDWHLGSKWIYFKSGSQYDSFHVYYVNGSSPSGALFLGRRGLFKYENGRQVLHTLEVYTKNGSLDQTELIKNEYLGDTLMIESYGKSIDGNAIYDSKFEYRYRNDLEVSRRFFSPIDQPKSEIRRVYQNEALIYEKNFIWRPWSKSWVTTQVVRYFNSEYEVIGMRESSPLSFNLYPNPTQEKVYIQTPLTFRRVQVLNLNGQVLINQSTSATGLMELNTASLLPGSYLVRMLGSNHVAQKVLIKQ